MHLPALVIHALFLLETAVAIPSGSPSPLSSVIAVKERHAVPRGWTAVSRPCRSHKLNLEIGLRHRNQDELERHALEVSDPYHARYGQYLSADEVRKLVAPADESVELVKAWLAEHGLTAATLNPTGDSIVLKDLPLAKAEELLDTTYSVFRHEDGEHLVRTTEWSLPIYLHEHVDVVQPTNSFFRMRKQATDYVRSESDITWDGGEDWWNGLQYDPSSGEPCDVSVVCNATGTNLAGATVQATTLTCLRCLYGTIDYTPQVPQENMIGVTNYLNETQSRSDIQQFLELYRPEAASVAYDFPIVSIAGGQDYQGPLDPDQIDEQLNLEGDLDGELVLGISWPTSFVSWVTGGSPPFMPDLFTPENTNEPYLTWLSYILGQSSIPQVISTSYGDDEQTIPLSYALRVCDGFKQLAARGVSVLFSSGDAGVGENGTCYSNTDPFEYKFLPSFPASCPWVTTVGGTQGYLPEVAVQRFGSGAGFSNYFAMPSYQTAAVQGYLAKIGDLYSGLYNSSGRGYPDVAAQSNHDVVVWGGNVTTIGGTSAACPTFAAVIALVNDALIAAGKPALGFLNPWLYGGAYTALTDITSGSSIGCNTSGFPATEGWDAVTGFGTPNFGKLVAAAMGQHWESLKDF